jgi:bifunctional enzyme CysN/CysC
MPVQGVYKFTENNDSRRIIAGTVEAGSVRAGDEIVFYPSGKKTHVKTLEVFNAPTPEKFQAGCAAGFTMTEQIFVRRGEIACRRDEPAPQVGVRLKANVFWLGKENFDRNRKYYFKCGTAKVEMTLESIERIVNAATLSAGQRQYCEKNEVCECILKLERPVAFDLAGSIDSTSRFVIVDGYEIAGGGIITQAMDEYDYNTRNIRWSSGDVTQEERVRMTGRKGLVVWMTGLSGSGKTTIAQEVERRLLEAGQPTYILDGDKIRRGLCADLGFSDADRTENIRRVGECANLFRDAGIITLVTLISPFAASRDQARRIVGKSFVEVYVKASVETCKARDPKNLYKKALDGNIPNFTGLTSPYEIPENPDLVLDTEKWSEVECVEALTSAILSKLEDSDL